LKRAQQAKIAGGVPPETRAQLDRVEILSRTFLNYSEPKSFKVGDYVRWISGGRNRSLFRYSDVGRITHVYANPIYAEYTNFDVSDKDKPKMENSEGSPLFREPLTAVVAFIDRDGDLSEVHVDGKRLEFVYPEDIDPKIFRDLQDRCDRLLDTRSSDFRPGDLIVWKPGLKNRKSPDENELALVVEVAAAPFYEPHDAGSIFFHEPLNIKFARFAHDGELVCYWLDGRRFQKVGGSDSDHQQQFLAQQQSAGVGQSRDVFSDSDSDGGYGLD
jgi:hypothetical protein